MKKLASVLMALTVILSVITLYSCDEKGAYAIYEKACSKMERLDSVEVDMEMSMTVSSLGISTTAEYDFNIKAENEEKIDNPKMRMVGSMKVLGQTVNMDVYLEDGWCYCDVANQKYKVRAEDNGDDTASEMLSLTEQELPEELFKGIEVTVEDGNKRIDITLSGEELMEYFGDAVEGLTDGLSIGDVDSTNISDAVVGIVVNSKGYLSEMTLSFGASVLGSKVTFTMTAKYVEPGSRVEITAPEGYKSYQTADGK